MSVIKMHSLCIAFVPSWLCGKINLMSKVYKFKKVQIIPCSLQAAWEYFSNPANLQAITPANMGFKVISEHNSAEIYPGQLIEYTVRPVFGIPVYWMTEITHAEKGKFFVDEQRYGPYSLWHHQHHFKKVPGGVEMTDIVHYKIPFWIFGDLANVILVKSKLKEIFDYRFKKVGEIFAKK
jgi:ligand-binding SRPBCC domain-containing protein